jgi:hypothetical protein
MRDSEIAAPGKSVLICAICGEVKIPALLAICKLIIFFQLKAAARYREIALPDDTSGAQLRLRGGAACGATSIMILNVTFVPQKKPLLN